MTTFAVGDTVRVKVTGELVEIDDVNENTTYQEDNEYFASGFRIDGTRTVEIDSPSDIEKVEIGPLPTAEQIAATLSGTLHQADDDSVRVIETSTNGPVIEVFGRDSVGIEIAFQVTVGEVRRVQL